MTQSGHEGAAFAAMHPNAQIEHPKRTTWALGSFRAEGFGAAQLVVNRRPERNNFSTNDSGLLSRRP